MLHHFVANVVASTSKWMKSKLSKCRIRFNGIAAWMLLPTFVTLLTDCETASSYRDSALPLRAELVFDFSVALRVDFAAAFSPTLFVSLTAALLANGSLSSSFSETGSCLIWKVAVVIRHWKLVAVFHRVPCVLVAWIVLTGLFSQRVLSSLLRPLPVAQTMVAAFVWHHCR